MRKLTSILMAASIMSLAVTTNAQTYGGTTPPPYCITVDASVSNPAITKTLEFVDNVSATGAKYAPNTTAVVKITVRNVSSNGVSNVVVTQDIPDYFTYFAGPATLSNGDRTLTINLGDMGANTEKAVYITLLSAKSENLPTNTSIVCSSTKIVANASNCNSDTDTAQLCIEKQVQGVTTTYEDQLKAVKVAPKAGPEMAYGLFAAQIALGGLGIYLRKRLS